MSNPYYEDPRMMGGGRQMDRRPDHGVCVFSHGVGRINPRAGSREINDLKKAFADQIMQTLHHSMDVVVVPNASGFSIEMWMPEHVKMPRFQEEPVFQAAPVPFPEDRVRTGTKLKAPPKKIFFYDQLKAEVEDWIKSTN
jgi:hypothetical protein